MEVIVIVKKKQQDMIFENKSPYGTILRNTNIYGDLKKMNIIGTVNKDTKIYVQQTQENNGKKYHFSMTLKGWIDYNDISCE